MESSGSHLDDDRFFKWFAKSLLYRPNRLPSLLDENKANRRYSRIPESTYQEFTIFDWLTALIQMRQSTTSKKLENMTFLNIAKTL